MILYTGPCLGECVRVRACAFECARCHPVTFDCLRFLPISSRPDVLSGLQTTRFQRVLSLVGSVRPAQLQVIAQPTSSWRHLCVDFTHFQNTYWSFQTSAFLFLILFFFLLFQRWTQNLSWHWSSSCRVRQHFPTVLNLSLNYFMCKSMWGSRLDWNICINII